MIDTLAARGTLRVALLCLGGGGVGGCKVAQAVRLADAAGPRLCGLATLNASSGFDGGERASARAASPPHRRVVDLIATAIHGPTLHAQDSPAPRDDSGALLLPRVRFH